MKPTRAKEYSVELKAQISRRGKMQYVMEASLPADTFKVAENIRQPFADALIAAVKKRSSKAKPGAQSK